MIEETEAIKERETAGVFFYRRDKDFFLERKRSITLIMILYLSMLLILLASLIIFVFLNVDDMGAGSRTIVGFTTVVAIIIDVFSIIKVVVSEKQIKKIKRAGTKNTIIIKRFFIYKIKPYQPKTHASYSMEFSFISDTSKTHKVAVLFTIGSFPFGIELNWPEKEKLIYDEVEGYYYLNAGDIEVPAVVSLDGKILILNKKNVT